MRSKKKVIHRFHARHARIMLINTGALARCPSSSVRHKLFQQFVTLREKPLKRLGRLQARKHRAKASVLMRLPVASVKDAGSTLAPWSLFGRDRFDHQIPLAFGGNRSL